MCDTRAFRKDRATGLQIADVALRKKSHRRRRAEMLNRKMAVPIVTM